MKKLLMNYCNRAYGASTAVEVYGATLGYQLGLGEKWRYFRLVQLAKYRETVAFPQNPSFLPVAVFTVGVTWRLASGWMCAMMLRLVMTVTVKSGRATTLRPLPTIPPAKTGPRDSMEDQNFET